MAFSEIELDQMRTYLGFPRLFISANPFLESAFQALQSQAEGGTYPDSTAENAVRGVLAIVAATDGYITSIGQQIVNLAVFKVPVSLSNGAVLEQDYRQALASLKRTGTDHIQKLAIRLGVQPLRPYFYSDGIEPNPGLYQGNPSWTGRSSRR